MSRDSERRKKLADKERRRQALARKHEFPTFVFEPNEADPAFVEDVKAAVAELDFRDRTQFLDWEEDVYRWVKKAGADYAMGRFHSELGPEDPESRRAKLHFTLNLGHQVFRRLKPETARRHLPFNDVLFTPEGVHVRAVFRALCRSRGPMGTLFHSQHRPTVEVGGRKLVVAFSGHAIERLGPRLVENPASYGGAGDVFGYLEQCLHFEVCQLHGGSLAFTFWENCGEGFYSYALARDVMGEAFVPGEKYHYRVGYCPAVIEGEFLKAKTLLFPGYSSTPEYGALARSGLPYERRRELLDQAKAATMKKLFEEGTDLVQLFHRHGVEQVRPGHVPYAEPQRPTAIKQAVPIVRRARSGDGFEIIGVDTSGRHAGHLGSASPSA